MKVELQSREGQLERLREIRAKATAEDTAVDDERIKRLTFLVDCRRADANDVAIHGDSFPSFAFVLLLFLACRTRR